MLVRALSQSDYLRWTSSALSIPLMMNVDSFKSFEDASGAPAVITVDGFSFSFDCLGRATTGHLITRTSRSPSKRVVSLAAWKYGELLKGLSAEWHTANRALYSDEPHYP